LEESFGIRTFSGLVNLNAKMLNCEEGTPLCCVADKVVQATQMKKRTTIMMKRDRKK
jgi:hypothetical protein